MKSGESVFVERLPIGLYKVTHCDGVKESVFVGAAASTIIHIVGTVLASEAREVPRADAT